VGVRKTGCVVLATESHLVPNRTANLCKLLATESQVRYAGFRGQ